MITTAGPKTCFFYSKLIECAAMEVLRPDEYFVWGMDYRVPVKYGLLQKKQLDEQRFSNTISSDSFARESMSIKFRLTLKLFNCWDVLKSIELQQKRELNVKV